MVLWEIGIFWKQGQGRIERQTKLKEVAKDRGRFSHFRFHVVKA